MTWLALAEVLHPEDLILAHCERRVYLTCSLPYYLVIKSSLSWWQFVQVLIIERLFGRRELVIGPWFALVQYVLHEFFKLGFALLMTRMGFMLRWGAASWHVHCVGVQRHREKFACTVTSTGASVIWFFVFVGEGSDLVALGLSGFYATICCNFDVILTGFMRRCTTALVPHFYMCMRCLSFCFLNSVSELLEIK